MEIHIHEGTKDTLAIWLPTWISKKGEKVRRSRPKGGDSPNVERVDVRSILVIGELTESSRMTQATELEARARQLIKWN